MPLIPNNRLLLTLLNILMIGIGAVLAQENENRTLELLGFLPMTGNGWNGGGACLPAALMAVRHVNEREGLLDGYNLSYTWVDTQVSALLLYRRASQE